MKRNLATSVVALSCAVLAASGVLWLTRAPGPGLSPDSMSYLSAGRSIARGDGPRVPFADWSDADSSARLRDFPPGYPAAIAAGIRLGRTAEQAARWVMALAAAAGTFGIALTVGSAAGPVAGAVAAAAVVLAPAFVEEHYIVLSEPLFLAMLVLLFGLMVAERQRPLALGLASGAAVMVRYAGVALPFAAALWCVLRPGTRRVRLTRAAIAAAPGAAAFLLWSHWAGAVREYGWKGQLGPTLIEGWGTLQGWLAPSLGPSALRIVLTVALLAAIAWLLAAAVRDPAGDGSVVRRVLSACAVLVPCYVGIVLVSRLVADEAIPLDNRLLSPVFLLATVAIIVAASARWPRSSRRARAAGIGVVALWFSGSVAVVCREARELSEDGWGYASADWVSSDLAQWLKADGRHYVLFSDNPPSLYSLTHRPSRRIDDKDESATPEEIGAALAGYRAAIIGFADTETGEHGRTAALAARLGYREVVHADEGVVWVK